MGEPALPCTALHGIRALQRRSEVGEGDEERLFTSTPESMAGETRQSRAGKGRARKCNLRQRSGRWSGAMEVLNPYLRRRILLKLPICEIAAAAEEGGGRGTGGKRARETTPSSWQET